MKKGDRPFRNFVNERLEAIFKNGDWAKAWERTVGAAGIQTPAPPAVDWYAGTDDSGARGTTTTGGSGGTGGSTSSSTTSSSTTSSSTTTTSRP
jgi:hypothetical protein